MIKEAYFLGIKRYGYYYSENNIEQSVFSGVTRNGLKFSEIKQIFEGLTLVKEIPIRFFKSFKTLDIRIKSTKISIKTNSEKELINNEYKPFPGSQHLCYASTWLRKGVPPSVKVGCRFRYWEGWLPAYAPLFQYKPVGRGTVPPPRGTGVEGLLFICRYWNK